MVKNILIGIKYQIEILVQKEVIRQNLMNEIFEESANV